MEILEAEINDAEEILYLQKICYRETGIRYSNLRIPPLKENLAEVKSNFSNQTILKVVENNKIIGSVRAYRKNRTCYIGRIIVDPDFQNQGIGTSLIEEVFTLFKKAKRFDIFTGHKDEKNLYLYKKIGFKEYKTEKMDNNLSIVYLEKLVK